MNRRHLQLAALGAALATACASSPRPRIMSQVDTVRQGAAAKESKALAPQMHARAEQLWAEAEAAHDDDDLPGAQILSEHSLAAFQHSFALTRLAKAQQRAKDATARLAKVEAELRTLDEQQQRVAAEADDVELRIKVQRDALPLVPNAPASAERERARLAAGRSLALEARLLCTAARLLVPKAEGLAAELDKLARLEEHLRGTPETAPIDDCVALRSACLRQLTTARRPEARKAPGAGRSDTLLAELSRAGDLFPFRDDRGVVVTLRGLTGADGKLTRAGGERLLALGRVAKSHPGFPVLVVVHSARGSASPRDESLAKTIAQALTDAGAPKVETTAAGDAHPVVSQQSKGGKAHNARVEIVFVSPAD